MSDSNRASAPAELVVTVVVPVRNEAGNVGLLVEELSAVLGGRWPFEVIFVNDGSDDGTEAELLPLMRARPWLRQLRHARSCGKAAAVRTGVMAARAELVVTMDGDGQNDPKFIPAMVQALIDGAPRVALIAGQRIHGRATAFKTFQSRVANSVRRRALRDGTRDTACGLKAFRRDVFLVLPFFDGLHRFLPALVRREGYDVGFVDVVDRPRHSGASNYGFWNRLWVGLVDLIGVWWLIRRRTRVPESTEVTSNAR